MIRSVDSCTGLSIVERRFRQAQQHALAADAVLGMVSIDQLAEFTGVKAAEFH
jgi:hypothetical protein